MLWRIPGVNVPPAVSLTAPLTGASSYAPASVPLSATAFDPDRTIAQVNFFAGTTLIANDTTSPYALTWTDVPVGTYTVTAMAIDNVRGRHRLFALSTQTPIVVASALLAVTDRTIRSTAPSKPRVIELIARS